MWFNLLKAELASKTGYAQLDFDNIVEEEDDNCRKRWLQLREKVENWAKENCSEFRYDNFKRRKANRYIKEGANHFVQTLFVKGGYMYIREYGMHVGEIEAEYNPNYPEEIYCKALDLLGEKDKTVEIGEYEIFRRNDFQMDVISIWHKGKSTATIGIYIDDDIFNNPKRWTDKEDVEKTKQLRQKFEGVLQ